MIVCIYLGGILIYPHSFAKVYDYSCKLPELTLILVLSNLRNESERRGLLENLTGTS